MTQIIVEDRLGDKLKHLKTTLQAQRISDKHMKKGNREIQRIINNH
jgi:hypothetical protein